MAAKTQPKNYRFTSADGRCTLLMLERGSDGRVHSVSAEYPMRGDNGRKLSRKQTIELLLEKVAQYYPVQ